MHLRAFVTALTAVAVVLWIGAATASATVLIGPEELVYEGTIQAASEGHVTLTGPLGIKAECASAFEASVASQGEEVTVKGNVTSLVFSSCTSGYTVTTLAAGSLEAHEASGGNGTPTSSGAEVTVKTPLGFSCIYKTSNTDIGTLTGSTSTGGNATFDVSATVPRTGHSAFCGSSATWAGSYKVTTPSTLNVQKAPTNYHFKLEKAPASIVGFGEVGDQTFDFDFGTIKCELFGALSKALADKAPYVTVFSPFFDKCTRGAEKPTFTDNGCYLKFRNGALNKGTAEGGLSIICGEGKPMEIKAEECTIKIPEQAEADGVKKVTYKTIGKGAERQVTAAVALEGLEYSEAGKKCKNDGKTLKNGKLSGGIVVKAEEEKEEKQLGIYLQDTA